MTDLSDDQLRDLHHRAYAAMDRGALGEASRDFGTLLNYAPDHHNYHYMRGLAHKYLLDWPSSLHHNLRAIASAEEMGEAEHWNAAIAATALEDWTQARKLWTACGLRIPEGQGPIDADYGVAVVRLNPWHGGETVFMRRIDPVRARLLNVPLPESGHRFGDIVLHDGASTGRRRYRDGEVPVFNALARLAPSEFRTFAVFARCGSRDDLDALLDATGPGIGYSEDWTDNVAYYCMRCSYGAPHDHAEDPGESDWEPDRNLGIAAQSLRSVEKLLEDWSTAAPGRRVDAIDSRECAIPAREDGHVWWREPNEADASNEPA